MAVLEVLEVVEVVEGLAGLELGRWVLGDGGGSRRRVRSMRACVCGVPWAAGAPIVSVYVVGKEKLPHVRVGRVQAQAQP